MPLVQETSDIVEKFFSPTKTYSLGAVDGIMKLKIKEPRFKVYDAEDPEWNLTVDTPELYEGAQDANAIKTGNLVIVGVSAYTWDVTDTNKRRNVGMSLKVEELHLLDKRGIFFKPYENCSPVKRKAEVLDLSDVL